MEGHAIVREGEAAARSAVVDMLAQCCAVILIAGCAVFASGHRRIVWNYAFGEIAAHFISTALLIAASAVIAVALAAGCVSLESAARRARVLRVIPALLLALPLAPLFLIAMIAQVWVAVRGIGFDGYTGQLVVPAVLLSLVQLDAYRRCLKQSRFELRTLFGVFADLLPIIISASLILDVLFARPGEGRTFINYFARSPHLVFFFAFLALNGIVVVVVRAFARLAGAAPRSIDARKAPWKKGPLAAASILAILGVLGIFVAPALAAHAAQLDTVAWRGYPVPPCFLKAHLCGGHVLGTDENGRDILARLIVGIRFTLGIAALAVVFELAFAAAAAGIARVRLRWIGSVVATVAGGLDAIPRLPLLMVVVYMMPSSLAPHVPLILALTYAAVMWPRAAFYLRDGKRTLTEVLRFALGDAATIVLLANLIDALGYGVMPPDPSWGNMLVNIQPFLQTSWWLAIAGICSWGLVLLLNAARQDTEPIRLL